MKLSNQLIELLQKATLCYVGTLMPDGSPQLTQTWVDTNGTQVLINTWRGSRKIANLERDPRVSVAVSDPKQTSSYSEIRGRVISITEEGAVEHIEKLSQRYLGRPYPWFGGRNQTRVIVTIEPMKVHRIGG